MNNVTQMAPDAAISYVQTLLGNIPYTLTQQQTVGNVLSQAIVILEQVKVAMIPPKEDAENKEG